MTKKFPKELTGAISKGTLIPFVGAGVSMAVRRKGDSSKPAYPDWKDLLLGAAKELGDENAEGEEAKVRELLSATSPDFYQAAQVALTRLGSHLWAKYLRSSFEPDHKTIEPGSLDLARAVWAVAPNVVITTNFRLRAALGLSRTGKPSRVGIG